MDYFSPGIRELARLAARWRGRWQLRGARKELAKRETELGLLGWQQAEFDPETQREVEKILKCEREQARLTNESAALSRAISELKMQREEARLAFEQNSTPLAAERRTLRESIEKTTAQIASLRRQVAELESREPQLDREVREASRLYKDLLATDPQTPELRDQQAELRERITAIPGQIAETQHRRARALLEMEESQKSVAHETDRESALAREARELESAHSIDDRKLADAISAKEREREKIEAENTRLDKEKTIPYREIGRVLADSHLPPMNQPEALDVVRKTRVRVQEIEYKIAKSRSDADAEDRTLVMNSLILLATVALAVAIVLAALISW